MQTMMRDDVFRPVLAGPSTANQKIERHWLDAREFCLQVYMDIFQKLESEEIEDGLSYLDVDNNLHKYVLQYLFLNRINDSLRDYVQMWNNHSLRLPETSIYIDPNTGNEIKSMIPKKIYERHDFNYGKYGLLDMFHEDDDIHNYLFYHNTNEELESVQVNEGLWELDAELLQLFQTTYATLTKENSNDNCYEIYKDAIKFIYDNANFN